MTGFNGTRGPLKMKRRHMTMEQFDSLPREVRDAINYSAFKYAVQSAPAHLAIQLAARICTRDAEQVEMACAQREAQDELKELGL